MIAISKAEKDAIVVPFPNAHIVRTMKQKSKRHRYYCEETIPITKCLCGMRSGEGAGGSVLNISREGGNNTNRKKTKRVTT